MFSMLLKCAKMVAPALNDTSIVRPDRSRRLQSAYAFANRAALLVARDAWCADPTAAAATYGHISTWVVSAVTDHDASRTDSIRL
mgnify:CR=1 FL=1